MNFIIILQRPKENISVKYLFVGSREREVKIKKFTVSFFGGMWGLRRKREDRLRLCE